MSNTEIELYKNFHYIFKQTDIGVKVLNHLRDLTIERSTLENNGMMDGGMLNPAEFVFIREGQNSLIRYIERMIKEEE